MGFLRSFMMSFKYGLNLGKATGKVKFLFFMSSNLAMTKILFWKEDWELSSNSIKF